MKRGDIVRYWRPVKGGWATAIFVKICERSGKHFGLARIQPVMESERYVEVENLKLWETGESR